MSVQNPIPALNPEADSYLSQGVPEGLAILLGEDKGHLSFLSKLLQKIPRSKKVSFATSGLIEVQMEHVIDRHMAEHIFSLLIREYAASFFKGQIQP